MQLTAFSFAVLFGCGGGSQQLAVGDVQARTSSRNAKQGDWVVLQISRVQVKPHQIDRSSWDGAQEKKGNSCGLVGTIGNAAGGPVAGAVATFICEQNGSSQSERDPRAPDLLVEVAAESLRFRTPIERDSYDAVFDYSVVIPLRGLGTNGLTLEVLDYDEGVRGQTIGRVRLSSMDLAAARTRTPPILTVGDAQLEKLEIVVLPYEPAPREELDVDIAKPLTALKRKVSAGEFIRVSARGSYSVADDRMLLTTHGYTKGEKRSYNLKGFERGNHAAAVARIGLSNESHASLVVEECLQTYAPVSGEVFLGINDEDLSNNSGKIHFTVERIVPSVEEWKLAATTSCSPP